VPESNSGPISTYQLPTKIAKRVDVALVFALSVKRGNLGMISVWDSRHSYNQAEENLKSTLIKKHTLK